MVLKCKCKNKRHHLQANATTAGTMASARHCGMDATTHYQDKSGTQLVQLRFLVTKTVDSQSS